MESEKERKIIVLAGPTAVGKTTYSINLATRLGCEIVSADSMQLYKYMDIGSAKPDETERGAVRHHLVDEIDPKVPFSAAKYQKLAKTAIEQIFARGRQPLVSGGTGLYINSLIYDMDFSVPPASGYRAQLEKLAAEHGNAYIHERLAEKDPEAAVRIHPNNLKKMIRALEVAENSGRRVMPFENSFVKTRDYQTVLLCLNRERDELYERINKRVDTLIAMGLEDEVKSLLSMGLEPGDISMKGIGYKEMIGFLNGEYSMADAVSMIKQNTRNYAKRQLTWFRRYDGMKWFNLSSYQNDEEAIEDMITWLAEKK